MERFGHIPSILTLSISSAILAHIAKDVDVVPTKDGFLFFSGVAAMGFGSVAAMRVGSQMQLWYDQKIKGIEP